MAKGKRKRKAPSQDAAHSADELNNPNHKEDLVLLSQPCSTATGVNSPAGKYIPKFSSKKPKLSTGREEHDRTPSKRIPLSSSRKTVGLEACPSEPEEGTEEAAIDQQAPQQAVIDVQEEEEESKQYAMQEGTPDAALVKVDQECVITEKCSYGPKSGSNSCLTSPAAAGRKELANNTASGPDALGGNVAVVGLVGNESEADGIASNGTLSHTEPQDLSEPGDSTKQLNCTETLGAEASSETTVAKLNQFCDLLGFDSDDEEEITLQPFISQQCGKIEKCSHELPLSQPAALAHCFGTPGLALSQAIQVPVGEMDNALVEDGTTATTADGTVEDDNEYCLWQVPTLQTGSSRECTSWELAEGRHDDQLMNQVESADINSSVGGSLPPHTQQVSDYAAVPCREGGGLGKDDSHGGVAPEPQGNQEGLSLYEGVGEGKVRQKVDEEGDELCEAEMEADPLLDSLMEDDYVDIDVCQLERQLQLEYPPEPLPGPTSTPTTGGAPKIIDMDSDEMNVEACSGDSSTTSSGRREGEVAGFDDSGVKLLQGILTELSSLNCFVMACRRELEATKRQRRQWLRTSRQQHQRK